MSIALFASAFHPSLGGVEELCRQLAHELKRQRQGVVVLTNRWPRDLPRYEVFEGIPVYRLAFRLPEGSAKAAINYHLTHRAIRGEMIGILRRHAVGTMHVQCVSSQAAYALHAQRMLGLPLVVTLQGELTMDATGLYQRSEHARMTLRKSLASADAITACSAQTLADAEAFNGSPLGHKASVVYNGVDLREFAGAAPHPHPRSYIFAIGRHVPQKGFDLLLRAFAQAGLLTHDLILAGDGPERPGLEQLSAELQLTGRVHFAGRTDRAATAALFAGCAFFVLPSREEPFGIVNLEAMAAGKAIIASSVGGVPEIAQDGVNGLLVEKENMRALVLALQRLATDRSLCNALGGAGHRLVQRFAWPAIARQYVEVYAAAAAARTGLSTEASI